MLWPRCGGIYTHEQRSRIRDEYIIDYILGLCHVSYIPAHLRGRLRRRAEGGAGSGVLRRRLVTVEPREARDPARQALRPGCEELALRTRRKCRRRKRGPRPKIATVERREASASRWTRAAPQEARTVARPQRATTEIVRLSALRSPLMGVDGKGTSKTRAQQRAAGRKKTALFDIVNRNIAATRSVPAERATSRAVHGRPLVSRPSARPGVDFARGVGTRARAGTQGPPDVPRQADIALRASSHGSRVSLSLPS